MKKLVKYLDGQPKIVLLAAAILLVPVIGFIDYLTGPEISCSICYLLPIALACWFVSTRSGVCLSILSAGMWLWADLASSHSYSHAFVPYWNAMVRFGFFIIVASALAALKTSLEHERELSTIDPLTRAMNVRSFCRVVEAETARAVRYHHLLTLAYLDIDDFKTVNDRLGHRGGDEVLRAVADAVRQAVRTPDVIGRLGGDEFAVLLPETGCESAESALNRIRTRLSDTLKANGWPITVSVGAVTFTQSPPPVDEVLKIAENLMYSAKKSGKNVVRHEVRGQTNPVKRNENDLQTRGRVI